MGIRFDGDCSIKRTGEGLGHLPVSGAGVDENASVRQAVDEFLQETFCVSLLIRVVEKGLERPLYKPRLASRKLVINSDFSTLSSYGNRSLPAPLQPAMR